MVFSLQKVLFASIRVLQYVCIVQCFRAHVAELVQCEGISMSPTLKTNDILIVEHITPKLKRLQRDDIIIAKNPTDDKMLICKRIVATDQDKIGIFPFRQFVPKNHLWIEGDNDSYSTDSNTFGPLPMGLVHSRVLCRIYPFRDFEWF